MNPANIERKEALHRSSVLTPSSYRVIVDLTGRDIDGSPLANPSENFISTSIVTFTSTGEDSWIDLIADRVISAQLDETELDPDSFVDNRLPIVAEAGDHQLTVTALCRYSRTGEGLHRFVDPADDRVYLYTQFETADARRMFACFEQPDMKATFQFTVIAPEHWVVLSNTKSPTPQPLPGGFAGHQFEPTLTMSTYITALIAGEYHVEPGEIMTVNGPIPAALACRQSMVKFLDSERIRTTTQRGFEIFEEAFGTPYAFDTYDQIFVPEFNAGAMENAGCVTFRDEYLFRTRQTSASYAMRDNTILHELAHMWFGDLVTMRWWDDLWLNESFAEWAAHYSALRIAQAHDGIDPWVGFANQRKTWAYTQDQMPTTHPVAADMVDLDAVEQNFDGITYAKGASVLKQLVAYVGEPEFLAGVKNYFLDHAFGNTEFSDLVSALEASSGRDLSGFSGDWLETAGVNTLRPIVETDDEGIITRFAVEQTAHPDYPTLRTHHLVIGLFDDVDDKLERVDQIEVEVSGELTEIDELVGRKRPVIVLLNDQDLAYAKVRFDQASLAAAVERVAEIDDPLARAIVYFGGWDMWRDAEMPSADFIDLVLASVGNESDMTAVASRLAAAQMAATAYSDASVRPTALTHLAAGLVRLLKDAEPGSDHQIAFADALIMAVNSPVGVELLKGWLVDEQVPEGLEIDSDRRWKIITTLARLGAIGEDDIVAEAERDQTIAGAEFAAGAASALKQPEAKEAAWELATNDADVPNGTHSKITMQFWQYGQEELLAGYADRYLTLVEAISNKDGIWAKRGHATIEKALTFLWPAPLADQAFLDRLETWMSERELSPSVVRTLSQRREASERALAAQKLSVAC